MGNLSFRKRTKGANGWINISASKKNGIGWSTSARLAKNVTLNWKPGRGFRTTISVPGTGIRWTSSTAKSKKQKAPAVKRIGVMEARAIERAQEARAEEFIGIYSDLHEQLMHIDDEVKIRFNEIDDFYIDVADVQNDRTIDNDEECNNVINRIIEIVNDRDEEINGLLFRREELLNELYDMLKANSYYLSLLVQLNNPIAIDDKLKEQPKYRFIEIRNNIIDADNMMSYREKLKWPDDSMPLLVRRTWFVRKMKELVEENAWSDEELPLHLSRVALAEKKAKPSLWKRIVSYIIPSDD